MHEYKCFSDFFFSFEYGKWDKNLAYIMFKLSIKGSSKDQLLYVNVEGLRGDDKYIHDIYMILI